MTFCEQSNFPFAGWTTATCKTGRLIEFGACKKRRLKSRRILACIMQPGRSNLTLRSTAIRNVELFQTSHLA